MKSLPLVLALVAFSCGSSTPPPTLTFPVGNREIGDFALLVYDSTGLVVGGTKSERVSGVFGNDAVTATPDRKELTIFWIGGACSHRPTLALTGSATELDLNLSQPQEWQPPLVHCPAMGIPFGVTLSLAVAVDQSALTFTVTH